MLKPRNLVDGSKASNAYALPEDIYSTGFVVNTFLNHHGKSEVNSNLDIVFGKSTTQTRRMNACFDNEDITKLRTRVSESGLAPRFEDNACTLVRCQNVDHGDSSNLSVLVQYGEVGQCEEALEPIRRHYRLRHNRSWGHGCVQRCVFSGERRDVKCVRRLQPATENGKEDVKSNKGMCRCICEQRAKLEFLLKTVSVVQEE